MEAPVAETPSPMPLPDVAQMTLAESRNYLMLLTDLNEVILGNIFNEDRKLEDLSADELQQLHDFYEGLWAVPYLLNNIQDLILEKRTQKCGKCKRTMPQKKFYSSERNKVLKTCYECLDWCHRRSDRPRSYRPRREFRSTKYNSISLFDNPMPTQAYIEALRNLRLRLGLPG
jgi:hypothetical protein